MYLSCLSNKGQLFSSLLFIMFPPNFLNVFGDPELCKRILVPENRNFRNTTDVRWQSDNLEGCTHRKTNSSGSIPCLLQASADRGLVNKGGVILYSSKFSRDLCTFFARLFRGLESIPSIFDVGWQVWCSAVFSFFSFFRFFFCQ